MTDDDARTCPAEHRDDRPRRAAEGSVLCRWCIEHGRENLTDLPRRYDELAEALKPGKSHQQRVSGTPDKTLPIVPAVAEHRKLIQDKLVIWTLNVADERCVTVPGSHADAPTHHAWDARAGTWREVRYGDVRPATLCTFLRRHFDWLMGTDWAGDFASELDGLCRRAFSFCYPSGRRTFEVGRCQEIYEVVLDEYEDGPVVRLNRCSGTLFAVVRDTDSLLPSELACSDCQVSIPADEWLRYGRKIRREAA